MAGYSSKPTDPKSQDTERSVPIDQGQRQLVLVKEGQRYVFRYALGDETGLLESLIEMARDPKSELTWFDAAMLSHQMGKRFGQQLEQIVKL